MCEDCLLKRALSCHKKNYMVICFILCHIYISLSFADVKKV